MTSLPDSITDFNKKIAYILPRTLFFTPSWQIIAVFGGWRDSVEDYTGIVCNFVGQKKERSCH